MKEYKNFSGTIQDWCMGCDTEDDRNPKCEDCKISGLHIFPDNEKIIDGPYVWFEIENGNVKCYDDKDATRVAKGDK